ncbi:MAG TPA: MFS transporter [Actinomycetota bacterium]
MSREHVPEATGPSSVRTALRPDVLPLLLGYWAFGQFWGVWVILVSYFQAYHHITDSRIGILYTLLATVAVLVMAFVAPRLQGLKISQSVSLSLASLAAGAAVIALQPSSLLIVGFAMVGLGNGLIDVYANVAAQRSEIRIGKPILQWMHACYALGGITGAAVAGLTQIAGMDHRVGVLYSAVALVVTALIAARKVPKEHVGTSTDTSFSVSALFKNPALWIPALVVLSSFLVEGSMDTWSGRYLIGELGATPGVAASVFIAYSAALFLGRMFAGRVLFGLGPRATILAAGIGAAVGGTIAAITDSPAVVGMAYLLMGFTIAAAAPAGFSLINVPDDEATNAVAAVSTVGYTGFIWSPPILGWVADSFSLRASVSVIVIATMGIIAGGLLAPRRMVVRD